MPSIVVLLTLSVITPVVICLPFKLYNQRQDGELNIHAQLDNFVLVLVPTSGINLLDIAAKSRPYKNNGGNFLQIFSRTPSVGVAPPSPYKVDIDKSAVVPLDRISDDADDNETVKQQSLRNDQTSPSLFQPVTALSQSVQLIGGNTNNNEVNKENNTGDNKQEKIKDNNDSENTEESLHHEFQSSQNSGETVKDSSSVVTAELELTPEKQISDSIHPAALDHQQQTVTAQNNVIVANSPPVTLSRTTSKTARFMSTSDEKKLKLLQSEVVVCSPGQSRTNSGECITTLSRQSRNGDLARLLSSLRYGLSPAST